MGRWGGGVGGGGGGGVGGMGVWSVCGREVPITITRVEGVVTHNGHIVRVEWEMGC